MEAGGKGEAGTVGVPMGREHGPSMETIYSSQDGPPLKQYLHLTTHFGPVFPLSPLEAPWSGAGMAESVFC
jgi:hypothetical protein